jgi:hypothetical protein
MMRSDRGLLAVALIATMFLTGFAQANMISAVTSSRTSMSTPTASYFDASKLTVKSSGSNIDKCWVKFDLANIGKGGIADYLVGGLRNSHVVIDSAVVSLYLLDPTAARTFDVSYLNDSTKENIGWVGSKTDAMALTWNNAPGNDTASASALLASKVQYVGNFSVPATDGYRVQIDIKNFISDDSDGIVQLVLHNSSGQVDIAAHSVSATYNPPSLPPSLDITYHVVPEPATLAILGLGGLLLRRRLAQ